jgi:hypothetical protein
MMRETGNRDLEDFRAWAPWFGRGQEFEIRAGPRPAADAAFQPSAAFVERFPVLTHLLSQARVTEFDLGDRRYHLYGWTDATGGSLGWLCLPPVTTFHKDWLHADHKLLLTGFGGIAERWNEPEDGTWLANHRDVLTEDSCEIGINHWDNYYRLSCDLDGMPAVIDPTDYASFAYEGNGDLTAYHLRTGRVVMFTHDHAFDHIDVLEGCPAYTFYTIRDCPDLHAWVETVAQQWLEHVNSSWDG